MAHEELMHWLPKDHEKVSDHGPFYIRYNDGSYSVVALNPVIISMGGPDSKKSAIELAQALNQVWIDDIEKYKRENMPQQGSSTEQEEIVSEVSQTETPSTPFHEITPNPTPIVTE